MPNNKKQWFLLIFATAWMLLILVGAAVVSVATRDARMFSIAPLITPSIFILRRLYHYHFPPSAEDYEIRRLKIQAKNNQRGQRRRAQS